MLDTKHTIPFVDLMDRPVVLELDSLNGDEKSLMMMFRWMLAMMVSNVSRMAEASPCTTYILLR